MVLLSCFDLAKGSGVGSCFRRALLGLALAGLLLGTTSAKALVTLGEFVIEASHQGLTIRHQDRGQVVFQSAAATDWMTVGKVNIEIQGHQGHFQFLPSDIWRCFTSQLLDQEPIGPGAAGWRWSLQGGALCQGRELHLVVTYVNQRRLAFAWDAGSDANFFAMASESNADETVHGFGLQPTFIDLKGQLVPIWTQEQGITRGRQPFTRIVNTAVRGAAGTPVTSYMTAPYFLTSRGRALFLKTHDYAEFDLRAESRIDSKVYGARLVGEWLAGEDPLSTIEAYTEYAGRMPLLPDWVHQGAIIGLQGGSTAVRAIWSKLKELGTPVAGLWLQDWQGQRASHYGSQLWWNWELDRQHYPGFADLVSELRRNGVRVLAYINPHLVDVAAQGKSHYQRNLYREAAARGLLVRNLLGFPYAVRLTAFTSGMLDLSLPSARQFVKDVIKETILNEGFSGWMGDFGEALPHDALMASGESGYQWHHRYVEEWVALHQEAINEAGAAGEAIAFCRAGYTQSPGRAMLFWQGDQTVTWDRYDGLRSAITGLIGGGLSGYSLNHSDIGGYTTGSYLGLGLRRERELLARWAEFAAFTPVFRTHEGNQPEANTQIYSDASTYAAFDRSARIFASLFRYRQELFREAMTKGYPVVRALFLHYPDDPLAYRLSDQFLLGRDLLVAPVAQKGARERSLYLPRGLWQHVWSGVTYGHPDRGSWITVAAPLGEPPAFVRGDSALAASWITALRLAGLSVPGLERRAFPR